MREPEMMHFLMPCFLNPMHQLESYAISTVSQLGNHHVTLHFHCKISSQDELSLELQQPSHGEK